MSYLAARTGESRPPDGSHQPTSPTLDTSLRHHPDEASHLFGKKKRFALRINRISRLTVAMTHRLRPARRKM